MSGEENKEIKLRHLVWAVIAIGALWVGNLLIGTFCLTSQTRGIYGDMFGAVNSLFSGLALAGLVYAILLQRQEIGLAKQDANRTKKMLEDQTEHLEKQNKRTEQQMFESTFFQMLKLLSDLVDQMDLRRDNSQKVIITTGKDVFPVFVKRVRNKIKPEEEIMYPADIDISTFDKRYKEFYEREKNELGHYFRVLYNIIKLVHEKCPVDKAFYSNIVRAQLSASEVELLYYNCVSRYGKEKFKPLIEEYGLLKHLPVDEVANKEIMNFYDPQAFGNSQP
ncbi:MAG: putative phage abortive infection protein [Cohaesibacter sp.]|jgi:hypothetical protein|nr:putative phage abortive infection protein [Cohaesibacter sp.]